MAFEKLAKEKQNKIINAACEVFAKHGYKKASMNDIAEAAGISKSVLFKYFSTKENLYLMLFRLASDSISEADDTALKQGNGDGDLFSSMRRAAKLRLSLFKEYPWIYRFAYTAAFDHDCFVRELVSKELTDYRKLHTQTGDAPQMEEGGAPKPMLYRGLRQDISPAAARQVIFWISQGYLEEKLLRDEIDPDALEKGYEEWIGILEVLLKDGSQTANPGKAEEGK